MAHHSPVDQYNYAPPNQPYLGTPPHGIPQAQPVYVPPGEQGNSGRWAAGLLGCFGDCGICCLGYLLPCVLYGQNVEMLTGESCCTPCCLYFLLSAVGCCACYACGQESGCGRNTACQRFPAMIAASTASAACALYAKRHGR
ncbi:hypothetical protein KFL_000460300 [Klebsormidium nitens]|uniref:PLAC8 family protein n=1 Tax=Klebsormidium nitens TaxID=105231 RepID=A0A1Y1HSG6_KLENI|nr:hypothetical protein KFL_000460300 [Klebsormidium nitens]|eukprot:GAQ80119.1 hypothetical protein KFL_000460300 [Klebsormidium nitens]